MRCGLRAPGALSGLTESSVRSSILEKTARPRVAAIACVLWQSAYAQPGPPSAAPTALEPALESRPWAEGVSDAEQAAANALYVAGNDQFTDSQYAQALIRYREALQHWDHPAIRYNMAICLIHLDQLVEAREHLEHSLAYGAAPLRGDTYREGLTHRRLLDAQLARLQIICHEPDAKVALDGKVLLTGRGTTELFLLPGEHQLTATKPGFTAALKTVVLVAGKLAFHEIDPTPEVEVTPPVVVTPWEHWNHLAIGGGAVFAAGALVYAIARSTFSAYDSEFARICPTGCDRVTAQRFPALRAKKDLAENERIVAYGLLGTGLAVALTAGLGFIADYGSVREKQKLKVVVVPAPGAATLSVTWMH